MTVPGWYALLLLGLAAFRTWRLLALDDILNRPRKWVVRLPRGWRDNELVPLTYRESWAEFLECPWCLGFWAALAWWGGFELWPHGSLIVAAPFAISAIVAGVASLLSD